jgi:cobalt/nickel transport protein
MINFIRISILIISLTLGAPNAHAHELWLDSKEFQPPEGGNVEIELRNGQNFKGINLPYFNKTVKQFFWVQNGERHKVKSRLGDVPAMSTSVESEGLVLVVYESTPSSITYEQWEKFTDFIKHKDFPDAEKSHIARGLPKTGFKEIYHRYSKALIGLGHSKGRDSNFGLETEFVAQTNPYVDSTKADFTAQLLYQQLPRKNTQVEVFERNPEGLVSIFMLRTDKNGSVSVPIKPGFDYLLDAVVLREAAPQTNKGAVWESLWAAMTFSVPSK